MEKEREVNSLILNELQMFRVRAYVNGRITYSFRVAADNKSEAEFKVRDYLASIRGNYGTIIARPAGHESFWQ
jgi:hypothetical protein